MPIYAMDMMAPGCPRVPQGGTGSLDLYSQGLAMAFCPALSPAPIGTKCGKPVCVTHRNQAKKNEVNGRKGQLEWPHVLGGLGVTWPSLISVSSSVYQQ